MTRLGLPASDWLRGLSKISERLSICAPEEWQDFESVRSAIDEALHLLNHEEEITLQGDAPQVLDVLFEHFAERRGKLAVALARAEKALGRTDLLAQFSRNDIRAEGDAQ